MVHGACGTACCRRPCTSTSRPRTSTGRRARCELLTEARAVAARPAGRAGPACPSFGISGTNAHVILEQAPRAADAGDAGAGEPAHRAARGAAGCCPAASAGGAARPGRRAARPPARAAGADPRRRRAARWPPPAPRFDHRAVVVGARPRRAARRTWPRWPRREPAPGVVTGTGRRHRPDRVRLPRPGLAVGRHGRRNCWRRPRCSPARLRRVRRGARAVRRLVAARRAARRRRRAVAGPGRRRPARAVRGDGVAGRAVASLGVDPAAVVGHSQGEIAAAYVAGALSLADAARVVALRSRAIAERWPAGRHGVGRRCPPTRCRELARAVGRTGRRRRGQRPGLRRRLRRRRRARRTASRDCAADGVRARRIPVDYASHSPQVEPIARTAPRPTLAALAPARRATIPFYSTVTGGRAGHHRAGRRVLVPQPAPDRAVRAGRPGPAGRRARRVRRGQPAPGAGSAHRGDARRGRTRPSPVLGTLRRDDGGAGAAARPRWPRLYVHGVARRLDRRCSPGRRRGRVDLPTYAFQRQRYWLGPAAAAGDVTAVGLGRAGHPLLGAAVPLPAPAAARCSPAGCPVAPRPGWPTTRVAGTGPAARHRLRRTGAARRRRGRLRHVDELTLAGAAGCCPSGAPSSSRSHVARRDEPGRRAVTVHSRPDERRRGRLDPARHRPRSHREPRRRAFDLTPGRPPGAAPVDVDGAYDRHWPRRLRLRPGLPGLRAAWRRGDEVFAEVDLPDRADGRRLRAAPGAASTPPCTPSASARSARRRPGCRSPGPACRCTRPARPRCGSASAAATRSPWTGRPHRRPGRLRRVAGLPPGRRGALASPVRADDLFRLDWPVVPVPDAATPAHAVLAEGGTAALAPLPDWVVLPVAGGDDPAASVREATGRVLTALQDWLADDGPPSPPAGPHPRRGRHRRGEPRRPGRRRRLGPGPLRPGRAPRPVRPGGHRPRTADDDRIAAAVRAAVATGEPQLAPAAATPSWCPGWPGAAYAGAPPRSIPTAPY